MRRAANRTSTCCSAIRYATPQVDSYITCVHTSAWRRSNGRDGQPRTDGFRKSVTTRPGFSYPWHEQSEPLHAHSRTDFQAATYGHAAVIGGPLPEAPHPPLDETRPPLLERELCFPTQGAVSKDPEFAFHRCRSPSPILKHSQNRKLTRPRVNPRAGSRGSHNKSNGSSETEALSWRALHSQSAPEGKYASPSPLPTLYLCFSLNNTHGHTDRRRP